MVISRFATWPHSVVVAAMVTVLATVPVRGDQILRWKLKKGDRIAYEVVEKTKTNTKVGGAGRSIDGEVTSTCNMTWEVKSIDDGGTAEVAHTLDRFRMKAQAADAQYADFEIDTAGNADIKGRSEHLARLNRAMCGVPITFKITQRGEITAVEVPEKLAASMREAISGAPGFAAIAPEEAIRPMIFRNAIVLPKDAVAKGNTWTTSREMKDARGKWVVNFIYTYEGLDLQSRTPAEKISFEAKQESTPNPDVPAAVVIIDQECVGSLSFDKSAGRLVSSSFTRKLTQAVGLQTSHSETTTMLKAVSLR